MARPRGVDVKRTTRLCDTEADDRAILMRAECLKDERRSIGKSRSIAAAAAAAAAGCVMMMAYVRPY